MIKARKNPVILDAMHKSPLFYPGVVLRAGILHDGGESLSSSAFQGRGSPSRKDVLVSNILKLAATLIYLNLASYPQFWFCKS
jgi:hypothetical protein